MAIALALDTTALTRASRLVAKVACAAVRDGIDLYLHGLFVTDDGRWTGVQQDTNHAKHQARRYHWTKAHQRRLGATQRRRRRRPGQQV